MSRTFVVGLDGANWHLIRPWIETGELSNIQQLRESGTWATSESCLPPVTFPNWKCYSSGKNPGKFGVFWFEMVNLGEQTIRTPNSAEFKTAELWDYLNEAGLSAGVINMPTMYPPRDIDGPIVCGGPGTSDSKYYKKETGYTSPQELEQKLEEEYNYQVHPEPLLSSRKERGEEVEAILSLLEKRFQVAHDLFEREKLDFMHVTLWYLNILQHFFWNGTPTKRAWLLVDDWLGKIDDLDETNLVVMSDHGCAPSDIEFYINEWLAEKDYLTQQHSIEDVFQRIGMTRERALSVAKRLGIVNVLATVVPNRLQRLIPEKAGSKRERKLEKIVLNRTEAVASGQGPIYLNTAAGTDLRENLIADLEAIDDEDGRPLFEQVYRAEEIYEGPFVDEGPDIVIEQPSGVSINDGIGGGRIKASPERWEAENVRDGLFMAKGPDFETNGKISDTSIVDIMPTVLAAMGLPVPTDVDGEVLPIIEHNVESVTYRSPIKIDSHGSSPGTDSEVEERLTHLGYME